MFDKKKIQQQISELLAAQEEVSNAILIENKERQEEDTSTVQELLAKQEMLEAQIMDLKNSINTGEAPHIGKSVTIKINGNSRDLTIVHPSAANPAAGMITVESPLYHAVKGKKKGEKVSVDTPAGAVVYEIVKTQL